MIRNGRSPLGSGVWPQPARVRFAGAALGGRWRARPAQCAPGRTSHTHQTSWLRAAVAISALTFLLAKPFPPSPSQNGYQHKDDSRRLRNCLDGHYACGHPHRQLSSVVALLLCLSLQAPPPNRPSPLRLIKPVRLTPTQILVAVASLYSVPFPPPI